VLPQETGSLDRESLQPNRHLVLWPYSRWRDPRLQLADDLICVSGEPIAHPLKIGIFNRQGWLGYFSGDIFFCKRFIAQPELTHVDFNSNCEIYVSHQFLELEILGPLCSLAPGEAVRHLETWELFVLSAEGKDVEGIRAFLRHLPG
jgi:hypothetical protein